MFFQDTNDIIFTVLLCLRVGGWEPLFKEERSWWNDLAMGSKRFINLTESSMEEPVGPCENPTDEFDDWVKNGMSAGHLDAMPNLQDGSELDPSLQSWLSLDDSSFQYEWDENREYEPSFDGSFGHEFQSDGFSEMLSPAAGSEVVAGLASGLASASQSSSSAFDASSYNRDIAVDSAWTSLSSQTLKQFWENDFWDNIMSPVVDPVDLLSSGLKRPAPVVMHNYDGGELEVSEEVVKKVAKQTPMDFTSCVKDILPHNWKEERESLHQTAIFRWHALLLSWHDAVDIVCALQCKGDKRMQLQIIVDIFYNKAPSTLVKRVRSLSRVTNFCLDRGIWVFLARRNRCLGSCVPKGIQVRLHLAWMPSWRLVFSLGMCLV